MKFSILRLFICIALLVFNHLAYCEDSDIYGLGNDSALDFIIWLAPLEDPIIHIENELEPNSENDLTKEECSRKIAAAIIIDFSENELSQIDNETIVKAISKLNLNRPTDLHRRASEVVAMCRDNEKSELRQYWLSKNEFYDWQRYLNQLEHSLNR